VKISEYCITVAFQLIHHPMLRVTRVPKILFRQMAKIMLQQLYFGQTFKKKFPKFLCIVKLIKLIIQDHWFANRYITLKYYWHRAPAAGTGGIAQKKF
jgi:hypothetical protein